MIVVIAKGGDLRVLLRYDLEADTAKRIITYIILYCSILPFSAYAAFDLMTFVDKFLIKKRMEKRFTKI